MGQQEKPGRGCGDHDGRDWGKFGKNSVESRRWDGALRRAGKNIHGEPLGDSGGDTEEGGKPPNIPGDVFWELPCNSWGIFASRKGRRRNIGFSRGWEFPPFPVAIRKRSQCRGTPKFQPGCEQRVWSPLCLDKTFQALIRVRRESRLFPGARRCLPGSRSPGRILGRGKMGLGTDCGASCPFFVHNGCK